MQLRTGMQPRLFELTEAQQLVRDAARNYAQKTLAPIAGQLDREGRFPQEQLAELAELGMMGVNIAEEYGGAQAGAVAYALAMMEIAHGCASTAVTMAVNNLVGETIARHGSEAQKKHYLPEITSGRFVAASFGLSEPHAGSDAAALRTTARRDGSEYVINGNKQWITSGDRAGVIIVWARTGVEGNRGISCFLVEGGSKGLHVGRHEDKMGLRASSTVSLSFEDLRVPASAMLGPEGRGFPIALGALDSGRVGIACQAIGIGTAALDSAVRYAKDRHTFGQPIANYQAIRFALADVATELDAARPQNAHARCKCAGIAAPSRSCRARNGQTIRSGNIGASPPSQARPSESAASSAACLHLSACARHLHLSHGSEWSRASPRSWR